MACEGLKPVAAIYSTFLQRGFDQIIHDVCLQDLNVTFAMDRAGIVGADGPTHHGLLDIAYLRGYPNIVLMSPKDEAELRDMLLTAIEHPAPAAIRYPRGNGVGVDISEKPKKIEIGKAEILREGEGVAILAYGSMVYPAIEAAKNLEKDGIEATVVNARFVKPLDEKLILELAGRSQFDLNGRRSVSRGRIRFGGSGIFRREKCIKRCESRPARRSRPHYHARRPESFESQIRSRRGRDL